MPHALGRWGHYSGTPEERYSDMAAALTDPEVRAAKHKGIHRVGFRTKSLKAHAALHLLQAHKLVALCLQGIDSLCRIGEITPCHGVFGTESGFMNLGRRRCGRNTAKHHLPHSESIARAKRCGALEILRTSFSFTSFHIS